ncbi:GNAT family N-acetyltransferase [Pseudomonas sp. o96-267]|uniref:GNAT family N-acetyltransferase n=1 Tax=Pseudomonas sp. o96-267 TaxID=2479853 RepID=UPI002114493E|nr:GNAT family N-acetyltransferase [Pseudomonas sp. o96-267]
MPDHSVTLTTPRLVLRPLQAADAAALFAIFSDPQVMQYWNTPPWSSEVVAQDFIRAEQQAMHDGQRLTLAIVDRESAELIGKCLLFNYEPGRVVQRSVLVLHRLPGARVTFRRRLASYCAMVSKLWS